MWTRHQRVRSFVKLGTANQPLAAYPEGMAADLTDSFGRTIRDLRISVTDRCNFRCTYCMPEEGMTWLPRDEVLTYEEMERIARLFVERYGVTGIRLTGGEPTVRAHLHRLVRMLSALGVDVAMTTNGATLRLLAESLREAGLRRVNISLDTLDRDKFVRMTRRDNLPQVLDGIDAAIDAGFEPVKINAVVERGVNDDEIVALASFGRERRVEVRFIEFMPLDAGGHWANSSVVSQDEIVDAISAIYPLEQLPARGRGARRPLALPRRRRHRRRDPHRHTPVLRRLRPSATHRRRPVPHLSLRHRRIRSARCDSPGCVRRRPGGDRRAGRRRQMGRASHQPGELHPPVTFDEPDRRLTIPSRPDPSTGWN